MSTTQEAFLERVDSAISDNPYLSGKHLRFETEQGKVVLRGTVHSFYQKQMAQEALRKIDGVSEIENQLQVVW